MRHRLIRPFVWHALMALALTAGCDTGPTGPCFDPTDSGKCQSHQDSTRTSGILTP
jgi:hypothetical protein